MPYQEKERTEEEIRKALKNEDKFKEMKSRFFGLMFTAGNIVVRMLESVREHVLEGKTMHHCVGSGTNYSLNPVCTSICPSSEALIIAVTLYSLLASTSTG